MSLHHFRMKRIIYSTVPLLFMCLMIIPSTLTVLLDLSQESLASGLKVSVICPELRIHLAHAG